MISGLIKLFGCSWSWILGSIWEWDEGRWLPAIESSLHIAHVRVRANERVFSCVLNPLRMDSPSVKCNIPPPFPSLPFYSLLSIYSCLRFRISPSFFKFLCNWNWGVIAKVIACKVHGLVKQKWMRYKYIHLKRDVNSMFMLETERAKDCLPSLRPLIKSSTALSIFLIFVLDQLPILNIPIFVH